MSKLEEAELMLAKFAQYRKLTTALEQFAAQADGTPRRSVTMMLWATKAAQGIGVDIGLLEEEGSNAIVALLAARQHDALQELMAAGLVDAEGNPL